MSAIGRLKEDIIQGDIQKGISEGEPIHPMVTIIAWHNHDAQLTSFIGEACDYKPGNIRVPEVLASLRVTAAIRLVRMTEE